MDIFEKQQRIEAIQKIVNVRWFNIAVLIALGVVLKLISPRWAEGFQYVEIGLMGVVAYGYNFIYWLFIRRPAEQISDRALNFIALCQVVVDQFLYTLIFYFSGTVESISFLLYYVAILIASSIYKTRGIVLSGLLAIFLHNGILTLEYYHLIPHITAYPGTNWFGIPEVTLGKIIGFTFYTVFVVAFSVALANLNRNREEKLRQQRDQLSGKTRLLTIQTEQLIQTKEELEKANLEAKEKIEELEKFSRLVVGRELRMAELKEELKNLKGETKPAKNQLTKKKN
jgi:hypothetical protein